MVHLYCGDGKGKTTAAMGLALRAIGHQKKVVIAQFLKDGTSGECRILGKMDGVTIMAANPFSKFSFQMNDEEKEQTRASIIRMFDAAIAYAMRERVFLLVLDEICSAISCGFLEETRVLNFLSNRPDELEVVMTGRNPSEALCAQADYISEISKRCHPFDRGIAAREGIEH